MPWCGWLGKVNDMTKINIDDDKWQTLATCSGADINLFFDDNRDERDVLFELCDNCPVHEQCLAHALVAEDYGYWAKTTPEDRKKMRKRLGIVLKRPEDRLDKSESVCGTDKGYRRHLRQNRLVGINEVMCEPCLNAHVLYNKMQYSKRKQSLFL